MRELFVNILNTSFSGSVVIGVILLLRLVLKRVPRKYICLLWLLAGLRLLTPFAIESSFSLQPPIEPLTEKQWEQIESFGHILQPGEPVDMPIPLTPEEMAAEEEMQPPFQSDITVEVFSIPNWPTLLPYLWMAGSVAMMLYAAVSYLRLRRRVRDAMILSEGIWVSGKLDSAFVLGFFRPQIYLGARLTEEERKLVLLHERCHIRRGDHIWKLLGFWALAVHWFNPLVWLGYVLLCRDMEMACDEAVVKEMDAAQRKAYSAALLACGTRGRSIAACPVAFGEVSVKQRIQNVLHYRKPGFWIVLISVIAVVVVAVCFLTSPVKKTPAALWDIQEVEDAAVCSIIGIYCPGTYSEVQEVAQVLKAVRIGPKQEMGAPVEEAWIELDGDGTVDTICFAEDFALIWGRQGEENTAVYAVENPEVMEELMASVYDGVKWLHPSAEPFATMDEPVKWVQGISMDAVERAKTGKTNGTSSEGGVMPLKRFRELVEILNAISGDAIGAEVESRAMTWVGIMNRYGENTRVTITDGANQLGAVILLTPDDRLELFLTDDAQKSEGLGAELLNVRCWEVRDNALLRFMRRLREAPSYIQYTTWYQEQVETGESDQQVWTDAEILTKLYAGIQELQSQEEYHIRMEMDLDCEYPYFTGQTQEFWKLANGDWYRIFAYETIHGEMTTVYMQSGGVQYACEYSDDVEEFTDRGWQEIPESSYAPLPPILTKDFTKLDVLEIQRDDGGFAVVLQNDWASEDGREKVYEYTYTFRLDQNGALTEIAAYSDAYSYVRSFVFDGYTRTKTRTGISFLTPDSETCTELIREALEEVS